MEVERRLALPEDRLSQPPSTGPVGAMVDALRQGTLYAAQTGLVQQLRNRLPALVDREDHMEVVKVASQIE